jgi:hypothetical protein
MGKLLAVDTGLLRDHPDLYSSSSQQLGDLLDCVRSFSGEWMSMTFIKPLEMCEVTSEFESVFGTFKK